MVDPFKSVNRIRGSRTKRNKLFNLTIRVRTFHDNPSLSSYRFHNIENNTLGYHPRVIYRRCKVLVRDGDEHHSVPTALTTKVGTGCQGGIVGDFEEQSQGPYYQGRGKQS